MSKRESLIKQIEIVEFNMRRLRTLLEAEFDVNTDVNLYCVQKSKLQLDNIEKEILEEKQSKFESLKLREWECVCGRKTTNQCLESCVVLEQAKGE